MSYLKCLINLGENSIKCCFMLKQLIKENLYIYNYMN